MNQRFAILLTAGLVACCGTKNTAGPGSSGAQTGTGASSPHALVYRTASDHQNHVPVLLSDDHSRIVSYPHPSDLRTPNGPPTPTPLAKGYLLDNRGISVHVAFLGMTYEEYAALENAPSMEQLESLIIDRDPLLELCECGRRAEFKDVAREITAWVEADELLKHCKKLK